MSFSISAGARSVNWLICKVVDRLAELTMQIVLATRNQHKKQELVAY
ncbi:MAG: hypothetical protein IPO99_10665 [Nitrospira sp.]|nr:hypothetical protein [Nitrospira sp.]